MRDPARIPEILNLINQYWLKHPDLRFNQLIYNLQYDFSEVNNGAGKIIERASDGFERVGFDLFNLEDDNFLDFLKTKTSNAKNI